MLGIANSRKLELLSVAVHRSPAILKQRVGTSKTYIRPLQCHLDLTPVKMEEEMVCLLNVVMHCFQQKKRFPCNTCTAIIASAYRKISAVWYRKMSAVWFGMQSRRFVGSHLKLLEEVIILEYLDALVCLLCNNLMIIIG